MFRMKYILVSVYQVCSNKSHGVKIVSAPGVTEFPYMILVKLKELELRYLAWNIFLWVSTKFVLQ
jgi:hypothetical protein